MTQPQPPLTEEQIRVAMKDPKHLERWVQDARPFVVFVGKDLVASLSYPDGHQVLQGIVYAYHYYRSKQGTGEIREYDDPVTGARLKAEITKDQRLTIPELDRCIRWLMRTVKELDPNWSINNAPL